MNTRINLDFFFNRSIGIDLKKNEIYKNNLKKCSQAADKLVFEIKNQSNEIFHSFSFNYQQNIKIKRDKIKRKKNVLVVGMGGSSAGTKAISSYLGKNIFYLDNYDPNFINNFFQNHNLKKFTVFVVSKSGKTFETLAIFNLIFQFLSKTMTEQQIKKNIIVIVEDTDNPLNNFAKKNNFQRIFHNKNIGGRYSVFSETSMLLFNFSPKVIARSTKKVINKLFNKNLNDQSNPVVNAAIILTLQKIYNVKFNVNILYDYSLKNFSYWFHQLFSESLGKNKNALTPLTSICPKDHHSMMQLFLEGANDKIFNIYPPSISGVFKKFDNLNFGSIEKKTPDSLLVAQFEALIKTFQQKKIPYRIIRGDRNPKNKLSNILELLAYNIVEIIILGYAQNINPYDQPAVEQIKLNTFNFSKNNN